MSYVLIFPKEEDWEMAEKRKVYAPRYQSDKQARVQAALLRMAGLSAAKIAHKTGRHVKTVEAEMKHPEHKKILRKCITTVGKRRLSKENWAVVEEALKENE